MTSDTAISIVQQGLWVALFVSAPVVGVAMAVGLLISIVQVVTQVQELTLTFIPKLLAIFFVVMIGGTWMLNKLVLFARELFVQIPVLVN